MFYGLGPVKFFYDLVQVTWSGYCFTVRYRFYSPVKMIHDRAEVICSS